MRNWAGNVTYSTERVLRPCTVEEACELVAANAAIRPLGTRHSFSRVADATGALLSTEHLDRIVEVGEQTVTVESGIRYGELGAALDRQGLAIANYASLPHISVGGAVATATHGSGAANPSLSAAVAAIELVRPDGSLLHLRRGDDAFPGAVVALGALGPVVRLTLDIQPAFALRQQVFERLPWGAVETHLDELLGLAYSVSLFTLWTEAGVEQVWVKSSDVVAECFGAVPAPGPRHPIAGAAPENCTEQLGVPGPPHERLPHFRLGFTPSGGDELQSEYAVAREHAVPALRALRPLGAKLTPLLLVSEIRAVAADDLWLSPFYGRDSVTIHFTWKPLGPEVEAVLPLVEAALAPFAARPHWGKVFLAPPLDRYPKLPAFRALRRELDPAGKFASDFLAQSAGT
ncbi:MAG TPA: FAD-binding protein [Gaiellaceae bacterium]|nr:FAD-binding protein [Gaiellaceae bacterium]